MGKQIFVNLPVKNLRKTMEFFTKVGFTFNPEFTNDDATCMVIDENIFAMLLVEKFFKTFTQKEICATNNKEVIMAISVNSREEVDNILQNAIEAGGTETRNLSDNGWMYARSFQDLNGHIWEILYIENSQ